MDFNEIFYLQTINFIFHLSQVITLLRMRTKIYSLKHENIEMKLFSVMMLTSLVGVVVSATYTSM